MKSGQRHLLPRLGRLLAWSLGGLVVLLGIVFAYAQTPLAKDQISRVLSERLSDPPARTEISGLGGLLPFDVRIGRISLADERGEWLRVEEARVELAPADLVAGRLRARRLGAERVTVERLPQTPEETSGFALPSLPELPEKLPPVVIERLYVEEIDLGAAILGREANFRLEGSLDTDADGKRLEAGLALHARDREDTELALRATLDLGSGTVALDVRGGDDGRLVGALVGRPETGPVTLAFSGRGPLRDFTAELRLDAENLARLDASLTLETAGTPRLLLDGRFVPAPGVLPPEYASLIGESASLAFELVRSTETRIVMPRLRVRSGLLELEGDGTLVLDENRIDGRVTARIADLSKASVLLGEEVGGRLALTARPAADGTLPAIALDVEGSGLRYRDLEGGTLVGRLTVAPLVPLDRPFAGLAVAGRIELREAARDGVPLGALDGAVLALDGRWHPGGTIEITELGLASPIVDARTTGRLDLAAGTGSLRTVASTAAPGDLLTLAFAGDPDLAAVSGRLEANLELSFADAFRRLEGKLALDAAELAGLPYGVGTLTGPAPGLRVRMTTRPDGGFGLRDLDFRADAFRLGGELDVLGAERRLAGDLALVLPDLTSLSSLLGTAVEGNGRAEITLAGSLADPAATVDLRIASPVVEGYRLDGMRLGLDARELASGPEGELRLEVMRGGTTVALAGGFRLGEDDLFLRAMELEGPRTSGRLDLALALDGLLAEGEVALKVGDLAALEPWHGQPLAGTLDLSLRLDRRRNRQDATLTFAADGVRSPYGDLARLRIAVEAADLFGAGRLDGDLALADLRRPDLAVETAVLRFSGPLADLAISADVAGEAGDPFDLAAEARLSLARTRQRLTLETLEGLLAGQKVKLRAPAEAVLERGVLDIDRLDLWVGEGTVRGELETAPDYRKARLEGTGLPLALLARFTDLPVSGALDFELDLESGGDSPRAEFRARVAELRVQDLLGVDHRPVALDLSLRLRDGLLRLDARSSVGDSGDSRLVFRMPVAWRELPPAGPPPGDTPLEGEIDARAELGVLAPLLGLREQYLTGRAELALRFSGTFAAPRVTGDFRLRDGRLEDGVTGVVLRDLVADVRAEGDRVTIGRLEARDAGDGRIAVSGELRFAPPGSRAYRLTLDAREFVFWNVPLATLRGGGRLLLEGDDDGGRLAGEVVLDRGEIRILARSGADVPVLPVIEVGDGEVVPVAVETIEPAAGPGYPVEVDVRIAIPGRLFARGGGLDSEWAGELRLAGTLPAVGATGTIEAKRALLDLLGRRFRLRQGRILFTGTVPPDPRIELVAYAESADLTALFHVTGPLADPSLLLESEPPLPRDEVVARLLFGEDAGRLEPLQAVQVATILAELEGGGFDILSELRDLTALDTLRVSSGRDGATAVETEDADTADSYVAAGKYLTDEIYVEVEQSVSGEQTAIRTEIELGAGVVASSVVDEAGGGVELEWRFDF